MSEETDGKAVYNLGKPYDPRKVRRGRASWWLIPVLVIGGTLILFAAYQGTIKQPVSSHQVVIPDEDAPQ